MALLRAYAELLRERAVPLGLVAESDADRLWDRHVLDSLRGLACVGAADHKAVDIGSGAGLPGVPLAIALPQVEFTLVEPKRRRTAFLESVAQVLRLANVAVVPSRVEDLDTAADLCLARAVASAADSWRKAAPLLGEGGRLVYWAGRTWGEDEADRMVDVGAKAEICLKPEFQWQGPLVIMSFVFPNFPQG